MNITPKCVTWESIQPDFDVKGSESLDVYPYITENDILNLFLNVQKKKTLQEYTDYKVAITSVSCMLSIRVEAIS